jgi:hypothetical protein
LGGEKVSEMKRREDEILLIPKNICVDGKEGEEIKLVSFFQKFRVTLESPFPVLYISEHISD